MQPRMLIGQINRLIPILKRAFSEKFAAEKQLDKVLYDKKKNVNHWQAILTAIFAETDNDFTAFLVIEDLDDYFYKMQQATVNLHNVQSEAEQLKSPVYVYCQAEQIEYAKLNTESVEIFCKIISLLALLMRQKYLLMEFADDDNANYFGNRLEELNDKHQKVIADLLSNLNDQIRQQAEHIAAVQHTITKNLTKFGYPFNLPELTETFPVGSSDKFTKTLEEWLTCLPNEFSSDTSSSVTEIYQAAAAASKLGKANELYSYQVEALAKAYRITAVNAYFQTEMAKFFADKEAIFQRLALSTENAKWFEDNQRVIVERMQRLIRLLHEFRVGVQILKNALQPLSCLINLKQEEVIAYQEMSRSYGKFYNSFTVHAAAVKEFNENLAALTKHKKSKTSKQAALSNQLASAKNCLAEASQTLTRITTTYEEIAQFKPQISVGQHLKNNWKISTLIGGIALGSLSALGYFYLALNVTALVAMATGAGVCGLLLGLAIGLCFDHLTRKKLPDPAIIVDEYFPEPLPSDPNKDSYVVLFASGLKPIPAPKPQPAKVIIPFSKPTIPFPNKQEVIPIHSFSFKK
jgi:hypothetical protein